VVYRGGWREIMLVEDKGLDGYWEEDDGLASGTQLTSFENEYFEDNSLVGSDPVNSNKGIEEMKKCNRAINTRKGSQ
jgi:hypothetical protein